MNKTRSNMHERSYFGEFTAEPLIAWLNLRRPKGDPVEGLIRLNADLSTFPLCGFPERTVAEEIRKKVAKTLRDTGFALSPMVKMATPKIWEIDWQLVGRMDPRQGLALVKLLQLAERAALHRVRQCGDKECGQWFYARFQHQRFHAKKCQQQTFRHDPEWQMYRRDYMKNLRQDQRLREKKRIRASKRKR